MVREARSGAGSRPSASVESNPRASWRADPSSGEYDAVRACIVEAAAACIEFRGLPNLRVAEVAVEAGCSRANLYRYFQDKDELIGAVLVREAELLADRVLALQPDGIDPCEVILRGLVDTLESMRSDEQLRAFFARGDAGAASRLATGSPGLGAAVARILDPVLARAREMGTLRPGVEAPEAAEWLIVVGTALLVSEWPKGRSRAQQIETLRRFLLPGLFEPEASRSSAGVEGA